MSTAWTLYFSAKAYTFFKYEDFSLMGVETS